MDPKKLKRGEGIMGPEFPGCVNTGKRPTLYRLPLTPEESKLCGGFRWAVGPNGALGRARKAMIYRAMTHKRQHVTGSDTVRFYRHLRQARARWEQDCAKLREAIGKLREARQAAMVDMQSANRERKIAGAFALSAL